MKIECCRYQYPVIGLHIYLQATINEGYFFFFETLALFSFKQPKKKEILFFFNNTFYSKR